MELRIDKVHKKYAQVTAIKELSFQVNQGDIFALLGPNGAGKSSLIRMLTGFTRPDAGTISLTIDDNEYSSIPSNTLGYLPEDRGLYPEKSVLKNLIYFARLNGLDKKNSLQQANYWLERFDLLERKNDQLKTLSKGNQQKVQLITAVIHQPLWVILDEPFSGLDPVNQEKVVEFLAELKTKGMTVILSAHQMAMVEKLADRMLLMNLGEAVLYGSINEIQQKIEGESTLTAQFTSAFDKALLPKVLNETQHHIVDDRTVEFSLSTENSMNELLKSLTQIGDVQTMHSKKLDLHQLYLNAISDHGETTHA